MSNPSKVIEVQEGKEVLQQELSRCRTSIRPRLKMLLLLIKGITSNTVLAAKVGVNRNCIACWKQRYEHGGLLTLVAERVKPLLPYQHRFENFYLFGAYSPINGQHFTLELPTCNSESFQLYLNAFSRQAVDELKILILDKGAFHPSKSLSLPDNIVLLFLPPYSPERNPAEKIWRHCKDHLANRLFKTLDDLSNHLQAIIQNTFSFQTIRSLTAFNFYTYAFNEIF